MPVVLHLVLNECAVLVTYMSGSGFLLVLNVVDEDLFRNHFLRFWVLSMFAGYGKWSGPVEWSVAMSSILLFATILTCGKFWFTKLSFLHTRSNKYNGFTLVAKF